SITSFALYGFPESHAASFALLAYASAFLKCHYLAAFTAAMLNNQPMGFYSPAILINDARRHGLRVRPVDVTRSDWACTVEAGVGCQVLGAREESPDRRVAASPCPRVVVSNFISPSPLLSVSPSPLLPV